MAAGFPAYHTERVQLDQQIDWRLIIEAAARQVGWRVGPWNGDHLNTTTGASMSSWGENVTFDISPEGVLTVTSKCGMTTQFIDWGKNKRNVMKFLDALYASIGRSLVSASAPGK